MGVDNKERKIKIKIVTKFLGHVFADASVSGKHM
jgi:hypothetical protein